MTNMGHAWPRKRVTPYAQICCMQHAVDFIFAEAASKAWVDQLINCVLFQQRPSLLQANQT
jgi:hypothetical protein